MASLVVAGDSSGSVTLAAPAVAGTTTLTLPTTSGTLVVTGGAQTVQFAAGSAAAPSITFTGDTNTGIYSPAADTIAFTEGGVEAMRIDSSGNVGIGTSSPNAKLQVVGNVMAGNGTASTPAYHFVGSSAIGMFTPDAGFSVAFSTNSTERMRITSGGFVKASNTGTYFDAVGNYHELRSNQNTNIAIFTNTAASGNVYGPYIAFTGQNPNNTTSYFLSCYDTTSERLTVRSNGGIANFSANDVNLSDAREKINIELAGSYLDKICAIPVKTFNYIDQNREEDDGLTLGVIAQDVQAVAPEFVMESDWSAEKDGSKMRFSIYQTDLQYALMKCIQEQQQIINDLKARIETLENT